MDNNLYPPYTIARSTPASTHLRHIWGKPLFRVLESFQTRGRALPLKRCAGMLWQIQPITKISAIKVLWGPKRPYDTLIRCQTVSVLPFKKNLTVHICCDVPGKKWVKCTVRFFFKFFIGNGLKDPWPRVLSLPGAQGGFVGDPTLLACDNIAVNVELSDVIRLFN